MTATVYIALGSNLGDKGANIEYGRTAIAQLQRTRLLAESSVEETEPIGPIHQPTYLNQMLAVETSLGPEELLCELNRIESECGRERRERWGPRTLDLDIVVFGDKAIDTPSLVVPHPELSNREFWQRELAELKLVAGE